MKLAPFVFLGLMIASCGTSTEEKVSNEDSDIESTEEVFVPMEIIMEVEEKEQMPEALAYEGVLLDCHSWNDANGENFFIRAEKGPELESVSEYGDELNKAQLNAYHFIKEEGAEDFKLVRELVDFVDGCEFDITCNFIGDMRLLDLDKDNIAEVIFGYRLACRSDVSPSAFKVVLFENGDKYILRGESVAIGDGGSFEPGEELNSAPESFLSEMESFWNTNMVEY